MTADVAPGIRELCLLAALTRRWGFQGDLPLVSRPWEELGGDFACHPWW